MAADVKELRRLIGVVQTEIDELPPFGKTAEDHKRYWIAADDAAATLIVMEGGRYHKGGTDVKLTLGGIKATCTSGASGVMSNWIAAAERSIRAQTGDAS